MCLCCHNKIIPTVGKEAISKALDFNPTKTSIRTFDNKIIFLNQKQIDEIKENALLIVATGVDLSCDIWAIQWPNHYEVQSFK